MFVASLIYVTGSKKSLFLMDSKEETRFQMLIKKTFRPNKTKKEN